MKKKLKDITIGEYMAVCNKAYEEGGNCEDCPLVGYVQTRPYCRVMFKDESDLDAEIEMEEEKK